MSPVTKMVGEKLRVKPLDIELLRAACREKIEIVVVEQNMNVNVEAYDNFGYVIVPGLLSLSEVEKLSYGVSRHYEGLYDNISIFDVLPLDYLQWRPANDQGEQGLSDFIIPISSVVTEVVKNSQIGECARKLCRNKEVRIYASSVVYKGPSNGKSVVDLHSDKAFWPNCSSDDMLTCWIPLQPVSKENGTLVVVEGSQKTKTPLHRKAFWSNDEIVDLECKALDMQIGDVSFHHCQTVHGSAANRGNMPRIAITLHIQPFDNMYVENEKKRSALDMIVRRTVDGYPDYSDPIFCPVL